MIRYEISDGVEAFTAGRGEALPYPVVQAHQVHGCEVAVIDRPGTTREELEGYDALVSNIPGVAIGVRTADCIPIHYNSEHCRISGNPILITSG